MICPSCRSEFRPGITHCNDCDLALLPALEAEADGQDREPIEVMRTEDLSLVPILRSLLDGAEIPYEIRGDQNFSLQPAFDLLTGREKTPILILVPAGRADEAKALLELPGSSVLDD